LQSLLFVARLWAKTKAHIAVFASIARLSAKTILIDVLQNFCRLPCLKPVGTLQLINGEIP
jgi:hypothetical protein